MKLTVRDQTTIGSVSRRDVKLTLVDLKEALRNSLWIGKRNRYASDTVQKIKTELGAGPIGRPKQLAQYIAASVILHCTDGWSYLGRALESLLRGDPHRARHLAYYAELRAAMSLLASVGVGVFNRQHFIIDGRSSVTSIPKQYSTHDFVWDCLEIWGGLRESGELFARVVKPESKELEDWLQPVGGAATVAAQAQAWFMQWGMDLSVPHFDQISRNESSYRPDGMHGTWSIDAEEVLSFAREFWVAMEPTSASRFDNVDRHILRVACESGFRGTTGTEPKGAAYNGHITRIVAAQNFEVSATRRWIEFLTRRSASSDILLMKYSQIPPYISHQTHLSVFSRAALLLRIASGSAIELIVQAGISADVLRFWWGAIGNSRGLWDGNRSADTILDLWADIAPVLRGVDDFQAAVENTEQTFFRAITEISPDLSGLGTCERIAVWSLTPAVV